MFRVQPIQARCVVVTVQYVTQTNQTNNAPILSLFFLPKSTQPSFFPSLCTHQNRQGSTDILILLRVELPCYATLTLAANGASLEMLLARRQLGVLGIHAALEGHDRAGLAPRDVLALLCVLVVEGLGDVTLDALGAEETFVHLLCLGACGKGNVNGRGEVGDLIVEERFAAGGIDDGELVESRRKRSATLLGQVHLVVKISVEVDGIFDSGRRRHEQQLTSDVVLEDVTSGARLIRLAEALGLETTSTGVGSEKLRGGRDTSTSLFSSACSDLDTVDGLEERLGHALSDETNRALELAELIDGQNAVADKVGLCGGKVGENETGAITEDNTLAEVDGLEMLRLTGCRRDRHLLCADKSVDGGRFTDVGVSYQTDLEFVISG